MVAGLKVGDKVKACTNKVLGDADCKKMFPSNWETAELCGQVISRAGHKTTVRFVGVQLPLQVGTRLLEHKDESPTAAAATSTTTDTEDAS